MVRVLHAHLLLAAAAEYFPLFHYPYLSKTPLIQPASSNTDSALLLVTMAEAGGRSHPLGSFRHIAQKGRVPLEWTRGSWGRRLYGPGFAVK